MKGSWILVLITACSILFMNVSQAATEEETSINLEKRAEISQLVGRDIRSLYLSLDQVDYLVDEEVKVSQLAPYARDGKTYMPLAIMEEAFQTPITWNLADYSAILLWQGNVLKISLFENKIYYKGKDLGDISPDISEEGIISVPVAEVFSALGISYEWIGQTSSVFAYQPVGKYLEVEIPEKIVTQEVFVREYLKFLASLTAQEDLESQKNLVDLAKSRLGMPYLGGAAGPYAFDCSGFVHWVLTTSGAKHYPRSSSQALFDLSDVISAEELRVGDLVFFTRTYSAGVLVTHSAIYIGDGQIIHAAGNRVQITPLSDGYWARHFYAFGRMR